MKKTRIIVAVVAAALMIMGVGYAAWSQSVSINTTGTLANLEVKAISVQDGATDLSSTAIRNGGKAVVINAPDVYPGVATKKYVVTLKNTGSLQTRVTGLHLAASGPVVNDVYLAIEDSLGLMEVSDVGDTTIPLTGAVTLSKGDTMVFNVYVGIRDDAHNYVNGEQRNYSFTFEPTFGQVTP